MSMRPTRKIIAEFVAVFLIGAVAGGLVIWSCTNTDLSTFMNKAATKPDAIAARINTKYATDYHFTPDEMKSIQPDIQDFANHLYQIRHQFGVDSVALMDDFHQKVAAKLTPQDRDAYLQAMAIRHAKLSALLLPDPGSPTPASQ